MILHVNLVCRKNDVLSIYNDAVAELIFRIDEWDRFEIKTAKSLFYLCLPSVVSSKCLDWLKKQNRISADTEVEETDQLEEPSLWEKHDIDNFSSGYLGTLGETCQKVLMDWAEGYNMS